MSNPNYIQASPTGTAPTDKSPASLTNQAHNVLLEHLRDGTLGSGMFLSMPMLVERLGFPIAAIREALKRAEATGLVTILPKRGILIMSATAQVTQESLELRAMLDCEGARRLLERSDDLPLAQLRAAHEELLALSTEHFDLNLQSRAIAVDLSLHDLLSSGLGNQLMTRIYSDNRDRIAIVQTQRPFLPDRIASAMTEHLDIIAALEMRDHERAVHSIMQHHLNTLRWWGIAAS